MNNALLLILAVSFIVFSFLRKKAVKVFTESNKYKQAIEAAEKTANDNHRSN